MKSKIKTLFIIFKSSFKLGVVRHSFNLRIRKVGDI